MAFTITHVGNSVFGDKRVRFLRVTADAATDAFASGLSIIDHIQLCPQSLTTGSPKIHINVLSAGTASNGFVSVTGVANGDVFRLTVIGR